MVTSTPILARASRLLATVLIDEVQICTVAELATEGYQTTRELTPKGEPVPALVQTFLLASPTDNRVITTISVKLPSGTPAEQGDAVKITRCTREPSLVGRTLLIDSISENGASLIRKATVTEFSHVEGQGKAVWRG